MLALIPATKLPATTHAEPIDCSNVYKRYLAPALKVCKLTDARRHDLRH
jgi:hypothetical protein